MIKISCDICLDLIPLVKDNVASEDSKELVREHIRECEFCKSEFNGSAGMVPEMNDRRVLQKIKHQVFLAALAIIIIGALIGIGLTEGPGLFYNIIIMPLVGAIAYLALNKRVYYFPVGLFVFSYFWILLKYSLDGFYINDGIFGLLLAPVYWSVIYSGLTILGAVIAFLLKFAFRKEADYEKND
ncbi:MAG TPA: zf-HC2 domain-containing protein [Clostridia bacterium]|nr:zf-HC2 domain-containing protein [Clostridia bacterium]